MMQVQDPRGGGVLVLVLVLLLQLGKELGIYLGIQLHSVVKC
jgi:hypothetical protein